MRQEKGQTVMKKKKKISSKLRKEIYIKVKMFFRLYYNLLVDIFRRIEDIAYACKKERKKVISPAEKGFWTFMTLIFILSFFKRKHTVVQERHTKNVILDQMKGRK